MKYDNVIFDMDGTMLNTGRSILKSVRAALKTLGLPDSSDEVLYSFIGPSIYDSFINTLKTDEETALKAVQIHRENYQTDAIFDCELYPGVLDMLKTLSGKGVKICVASSKPRESVVRILQHFDIAQYFTTISAPDFGEKSSDKAGLIGATKSGKCVMVGDRKFDILGANANNIDSIAVTYGFAPKGELEACNPTYFADNAEQVIDIILNK